MSIHVIHALDSGVNDQQVRTAVDAALFHYGATPQPGQRHFDSAGNVDAQHGQAIKRYRTDQAQRLIAQYKQTRGDSLGSGAGGFPRDFEHLYGKVWEEKFKPLNWTKFPLDTSIPLGARSWAKRRRVGAGSAKYHRGATSGIPVVSTALNEATGSVAYIVAAVEMNFFQALATDFAGRDQFAADLRYGRMAVEQKMNDAFWTGESSLGIYGALTHPHLPKKVSATSLNASGTSAADILAELNSLADFPITQSGSRFKADKMLVAPSIHRAIHQRARSTTSDTTIAEYFLKGQPSDGIQEIEMAQELEAAGPNGEHGVLCFRGDPDALAAKLVQAPTVLPVFQKDSVTQQSVIFAAVGGVDMVDVGNNILGFYPAS